MARARRRRTARRACDGGRRGLEKLLKGEVEPPHIPTVRHPTDLSNFDDYDKVTDLCDGEPYDMSSPEWDVDF